jgi:hypothetical protein
VTAASGLLASGNGSKTKPTAEQNGDGGGGKKKGEKKMKRTVTICAIT